jgi:CRP-like cAMP-binding protein
VIANLPMFRQVPRQGLAELTRQARSRELRRGDIVAQPGERLPGLLAVVYGLVKLSLRGEHGEERILRLVGPGDTFGEAMLFLDRPAPVQAAALTDTLLAIIPAEPLLRLIDTDSRFTRAMLASMSQRLNALVADFEALTLHGARERVAAYLGSLAEPGSGPVAVLLPAPKNVIASRLGVTKETLSRILRELAQQGLIAVKRREITLLERTALAAAGGHAWQVGGE